MLNFNLGPRNVTCDPTRLSTKMRDRAMSFMTRGTPRRPWKRMPTPTVSMPNLRELMPRLRRGNGRMHIVGWQMLMGGAALGAALMYFCDPQQGNRRRKMAADRTVGVVRRSGRALGRQGRRVTTDLAGKTEALRHMRDEHEPQDDATLAHKVESVLFRDPHIPKGCININSEHGVVVIRGEVESPDEIRMIERTVKGIKGVDDVRNMLHLVSSPAAT